MRFGLLLILLLSLASCVKPSSHLSFEDALKLAKAQPEKVMYEYENKWDPVNNENRLDEKNDCYSKASGLTRQVLIINQEGIVVDVITDIDNLKSQCFRETYLGFKFPSPPFAPYYMYLQMH